MSEESELVRALRERIAEALDALDADEPRLAAKILRRPFSPGEPT